MKTVLLVFETGAQASSLAIDIARPTRRQPGRLRSSPLTRMVLTSNNHPSYPTNPGAAG
jgi:hypothetical protein